MSIDHTHTLVSRAQDTLLPARNVCTRYCISRRTLDRWLASDVLGFPTPLVINHRRYWRLAQIEGWERDRASMRGNA